MQIFPFGFIANNGFIHLRFAFFLKDEVFLCFLMFYSGQFFVLCVGVGEGIAHYTVVDVLGSVLFLQHFSGSDRVWGVVFLHTDHVGVMLSVCGVSVVACSVFLIP
jgi:hypothetical protein